MPRDIVLAIDIEPSGRVEPGGDGWGGTLAAFHEIVGLRTRLEQQTGAPVRFNWFLRADPQIEQIWGDAGYVETACPELVEFLKNSGDFCGIHTHFWRWDEARNRWFNDFSDSWTARCLTQNITEFERIFGYRPRGSRFGDRWCSNALIALLRQEGIQYDMTVEPGLPNQPVFDDPHATCWLPDYRRAPRVPYQPSTTDYLTPGPHSAGKLWILPLTTTPTRWFPVRRLPFLMNVSRSPNLVIWPRMWWRDLECELGASSAEPLALVMRTGDLAFPRYLDSFRYMAGRIANHPNIRQTRFTRLDEAVERFARSQ